MTTGDGFHSGDLEPCELTIEQLARHTGMTVRNIRAHQSRGLLPPPQMRGRTGYYNRQHAERIELIQELQSEGFNLQAITALVQADHGALRRFRYLRRSLLEELAVDADAVLSPEGEAAIRALAPDMLEKLLGRGTVRRLPDGRLAAGNALMLSACRLLVDRHGLRISDITELGDAVNAHAEAVTAACRELLEAAQAAGRGPRPEGRDDALELTLAVAAEFFRANLVRAIQSPA